MSERGGAWWTEHDRPLPMRPAPAVDRRRSAPLFELADPERLRAYRQALTDKASSLPHGGRRRDVERQLAQVTRQLLVLELRGRK